MKQNIALVLSGGGARGIAHIGVIEELLNRGHNITSVSGTSMGAVIAGVFALGKLPEFRDWLYTLDRLATFKLFDFSFSHSGLIKGQRVFQEMKKFIPDHKIEELPIPFSASAVDLISNQEVVFNTGSIYEALRASVSIPALIRPVFKKDSILVDGGVLNNIPINNIKRHKDDLLVAVDVNAHIPLKYPKLSIEEKKKQHNLYKKGLEEFKKYISKDSKHKTKEKHLNYTDIIIKTINLMIEKIAEENLKKHTPDILIKISRDASGTFEFYRAKELVEIGRYAAALKLDGLNN